MRCATCGAENLADAKFCTTCGSPLEARHSDTQSVKYCTSCGTENSPEAKFCTSCGGPLQVSPERGAPLEGGYAQGGYGPSTAELNPMDLGELLTETFKVYRARFWIFFRIALLAQIPFLIAELAGTPAVSFLFFAVGILLYILADGAIIFATTQHYLGREIRVAECYGQAWGKVLSLIGGAIVLLIALALSAVASVIIIGIPVFFYLLVSRFFYPQAIILEGKGPLTGLRRSRELVKGTWWRVFGLGVVFVIVTLAISVALTIPGFIAALFGPTPAAILFTISESIATPIGYIGATLVYFDLRVRKEGYTTERMAWEAGT